VTLLDFLRDCQIWLPTKKSGGAKRASFLKKMKKFRTRLPVILFSSINTLAI